MPSTTTADCKVVCVIGPDQTLASLNPTTDYGLHNPEYPSWVSSAEAVSNPVTLGSHVQTSKNQ